MHRIGRTGRAGATGRAFTFVSDEDAEAIANVEKLTGMVIPLYQAEGLEESDARAPRKRERPERPRQDKPERASAERAHSERAPAERRQREPRNETRRDERPEQRRREPVAAAPAAHANGPDEGWNGPVPSFLGVSAL